MQQSPSRSFSSSFSSESPPPPPPPFLSSPALLVLPHMSTPEVAAVSFPPPLPSLFFPSSPLSPLPPIGLQQWTRLVTKSAARYAILEREKVGKGEKGRLCVGRYPLLKDGRQIATPAEEKRKKEKVEKSFFFPDSRKRKKGGGRREIARISPLSGCFHLSFVPWSSLSLPFPSFAAVKSKSAFSFLPHNHLPLSLPWLQEEEFDGYCARLLVIVEVVVVVVVAGSSHTPPSDLWGAFSLPSSFPLKALGSVAGWMEGRKKRWGEP